MHQARNDGSGHGELMFDSRILPVKNDPTICGQPQRGSATVQAAGEA
jgi:hypothetical protein